MSERNKVVPDEILNKAFLSQFKTEADVSKFLKQLHAEVLGMWVGKSKSSAFWMGVLTDLKARGVQDILITCTDNLNGFISQIY